MKTNRWMLLAALLAALALPATAAAQGRGAGGGGGGASGGAPGGKPPAPEDGQPKGGPPKGDTGGGAADESGQSPTALDEKTLVNDFNRAFKTSDANKRAAALTALGDLSRGLADAGASKTVGKALARGLEDDELDVRAAALVQFAWGRHVDTTVPALGAMLDELRKDILKRVTNPDEQEQDWAKRGVRVYQDGARILSYYRDDRAVEFLVKEIEALPKNTNMEGHAARLIGPLADALLELGSADAVETAVRRAGYFTGEHQESTARVLHASLARFATKFGHAGPEYSELYGVAWDDWLEEWGKDLPKKLGKLKEPPAARSEAEMIKDGAGWADPDDGKAAPR